jgi:hypothetical protein
MYYGLYVESGLQSFEIIKKVGTIFPAILRFLSACLSNGLDLTSLKGCGKYRSLHSGIIFDDIFFV